MKERKTLEEIAAKRGTNKSNISRQESLSSEVSPRLLIVEDYARALGYRLKVSFERKAHQRPLLLRIKRQTASAKLSALAEGELLARPYSAARLVIFHEDVHTVKERLSLFAIHSFRQSVWSVRL